MTFAPDPGGDVDALMARVRADARALRGPAQTLLAGLLRVLRRLRR
jgi:hypothetical protein